MPLADFRESAVDPTRPLKAYDGVRGVADIYSASFEFAPGLHGGCTVATAVTHMPSTTSSETYTLLDLCRLDDDGLECPINLSFAECEYKHLTVFTNLYIYLTHADKMTD